MQFLAVPAGSLEDFQAEAVVVPLRLAGPAQAPTPVVPSAYADKLSGIARQLNLVTAGSTALVPASAVGELRCRTLVLVVVGGNGDAVAELASIRDAVARAVRSLAPLSPDDVVVPFAGFHRPEWPAAQLATAVVESAVLGCYSYDRYRKRPAAISRFLFPGLDAAQVRRGVVLGNATNLARDLVNTPGGDMTPAGIADRCISECEARGIAVRVLDEVQLEAGGFGGICAVGRASANPPRLVVIGEATDPGAGTALVGKGITFDSGGLSIKTGMQMLTMKCDMAGAAAVLATVVAASELGVGAGVTGYLACAENSVGSKAYRPSDVLTHRNGKTSEVISTDAEGRLVLADALALAAEARPARIVAVSTLTGATGLGPDLWGVMGSDRSLSRGLVRVGQLAGEPGWELPLWEGYRDSLHSEVADLKNFDTDASWGNGAILGTLFLGEFVGDVPWAHVDMAATAFREKAAPGWAAGATGSPVRTLVTWLEGRDAVA